jgi:hypothetical protein
MNTQQPAASNRALPSTEVAAIFWEHEVPARTYGNHPPARRIALYRDQQYAHLHKTILDHYRDWWAARQAQQARQHTATSSGNQPLASSPEHGNAPATIQHTNPTSLFATTNKPWSSASASSAQPGSVAATTSQPSTPHRARETAPVTSTTNATNTTTTTNASTTPSTSTAPRYTCLNCNNNEPLDFSEHGNNGVHCSNCCAKMKASKYCIWYKADEAAREGKVPGLPPNIRQEIQKRWTACEAEQIRIRSTCHCVDRRNKSTEKKTPSKPRTLLPSPSEGPEQSAASSPSKSAPRQPLSPSTDSSGQSLSLRGAPPTFPRQTYHNMPGNLQFGGVAPGPATALGGANVLQSDPRQPPATPTHPALPIRGPGLPSTGSPKVNDQWSTHTASQPVLSRIAPPIATPRPADTTSPMHLDSRAGKVQPASQPTTPNPHSNLPLRQRSTPISTGPSTKTKSPVSQEQRTPRPAPPPRPQFNLAPPSQAQPVPGPYASPMELYNYIQTANQVQWHLLPDPVPMAISDRPVHMATGTYGFTWASNTIRKGQSEGRADFFFPGRQGDFGYHSGDDVDYCEACERMRRERGGIPRTVLEEIHSRQQGRERGG